MKSEMPEHRNKPQRSGYQYHAWAPENKLVNLSLLCICTIDCLSLPLLECGTFLGLSVEIQNYH